MSPQLNQHNPDCYVAACGGSAAAVADDDDKINKQKHTHKIVLLLLPT